MIHYVVGDIFATSKIKYFAHGCDCSDNMNAGIALQFKQKWPNMFIEYKKLCILKKISIGNVFLWNENGQYIFNLATQKTSKTPATTKAITSSLEKMIEKSLEIKLPYIVLPKIGSGFGKLKWDTVKFIIEEVDYNQTIDLVICENFKKNLTITNYYFL